MSKYILLHASKKHPGTYKYVDVDFSFPYGITSKSHPQIVFRTKWGAKDACEEMNRDAVRWSPLYGIGSYTWTWDVMDKHPEYTEYLTKMRKYRKEKKRLSKLPAHEADTWTLVRPKRPLGTAETAVNMPVGVGSAVTYNYAAGSSQTVNTSDDFNALLLQVSDLSHRLVRLEGEAQERDDMVGDELERQQKALVAFGAIIKGMDDRLEDLEHRPPPPGSGLTV